MLKICQYLLTNLPFGNLRRAASIAATSWNSSNDKYNAGLIIIGDEILKAQVKDTNSHFMCSLLWQCGVKVERISVIGDDVDIIANEIIEFSRKYRYVITSGGIGPTHDDMTYEGLAKAFNDSLHFHPQLVEAVKNVYKIDNRQSPAYKLAHIPKKAVLRFGKHPKTGETIRFPCVNVENVYVFPGSPIYLELLFKSLCEELFKGNCKFCKSELYLDAKEETFADALTKAAKEFPKVAFGSYPIANESYFQTKITIESDNENETSQALSRFTSLIPSDIIVKYDKNPQIEPCAKFEAFMKEYQCDAYRNTLDELREFYSEPGKVAISFDGSVESTVLLHLAHIAHTELKNSSKINVVIFKYEEWFDEAEKFVQEISSRYNLNVITINLPPQEGVARLSVLRPDIKFLLLGIKSKNKDSGLYHNLAKHSEPSCLVIKCPLNGWTVDSLWTLVRSLSLPYCSLYDKGYTCVGGRQTTKPNVNLINGDKEICQQAWKLNYIKK